VIRVGLDEQAVPLLDVGQEHAVPSRPDSTSNRSVIPIRPSNSAITPSSPCWLKQHNS
jgi:hypothetical protein